MKKIKSFLSEHPEYLAIVIIILIVTFFIVQFTKPEFTNSLNGYFRKPITEMTIGEFVFILWLINAVFSK